MQVPKYQKWHLIESGAYKNGNINIIEKKNSETSLFWSFVFQRLRLQELRLILAEKF